MFKGLQSDYVVFISPPDKVFPYERALESFAIKDLYSYTLTPSRGQEKVIFSDVFHDIYIYQKSAKNICTH